MQQEQLANIVHFWSFWDKDIPKSVTRRINLPPKLSKDFILAVQGVRRCGKSTLLTQLPAYYNLPIERCLFINFEDPRLIGELDSNLLFSITDFFNTKYPDNTNLYYFFDEIQQVENWEKWLHTQLERNTRNHFIITGSNASLLSGELATALTGRHKTIELFPFDFAESLSHNPKLTPLEYLAEGGFPKVQLASDPVLLQHYFRDIVERDIANRIGARSYEPILQVLKLAFDTCGSEASLRKIAGSTGVSTDSVGSYLTAAEQAYLLFSCPYFAYSARKRLVRNKKFYPIDTGLRSAVTTTNQRDWGKSLETAVFIALRKRFKEVFYWRDKGEVDFVINFQNQPLPIQVTLEKPAERHEKALEEFYSYFPQAHNPIFLTLEDLASNFDKLYPFQMKKS